MSDRGKVFSFVIVLGVLWCLLVSSAFAQTATSTDGGFQRMMSNIVRGTPGVTNVPVSGGVSSSASGLVNVSVRGASIPINATATATVGNAALAKGAMRIGMRAVPWVGTALIVNDLANAVKDSGYVTCPPPAFFCKIADPSGTAPSALEFRYSCVIAGAETLCNTWVTTAAAGCANRAAAASQYVQSDGVTKLPFYVISVGGAPSYTCTYKTDGLAGKYSATTLTQAAGLRGMCPDGTVVAANGLCNTYDPSKPSVPATPDQLEQQINQAISNGKIAPKDLKDKLDQVAALNPSLEPAVDVKPAPLAVTAAPVTLPEKILITRTIQNPDGTTSTEVLKETTTVTPQVVTPSTVAEPNVTFPSTTTVTTTTTNNTTNVTNTKTEIISNPAPSPAESKPLELPTDYNREATQRSILDAITQPVTSTAPDGKSDSDAMKVESDKSVAGISQITEASTGIFSWFPQVPAAACVDPQVPIPITGALVSVPICSTVNLFRLLVSGVICFFCLLGCVGQVQAASKA